MAPECSDKERQIVPLERVERRILLIRGHRVMLDVDLAQLYGVPTKRLNEQVKRNLDRFPSDFMFRLSRAEVEELNRSQIATGSQKHRDPRFPPYAFTEHGAIMAANVIISRRAVEQGWSRAVLVHQIESGLFKRQENAPIPSPRLAPPEAAA